LSLAAGDLTQAVRIPLAPGARPATAPRSPDEPHAIAARRLPLEPPSTDVTPPAQRVDHPPRAERAVDSDLPEQDRRRAHQTTPTARSLPAWGEAVVSQEDAPQHPPERRAVSDVVAVQREARPREDLHGPALRHTPRDQHVVARTRGTREPATVIRRDDQRRSPTEAKAAEQPAPTIRVTIGRVDVRAVHAPERPQPQRPRPPAPHLTLEDYLRDRNAGRR
jgi:hypothetical protein